MFHCLVIKVCCACLSDSSFILSHLFLFVKHFFKFFSNIFELRFCCRFVDDLDTLSYLLSFVNYFFILFFKFFFICISNSDIVSCLQFPVNTFFIFFSTLFNKSLLSVKKNPPHSEADLSYHYFLFASSIILHFFTYFLRHLRYRYNILIFNAPISE